MTWFGRIGLGAVVVLTAAFVVGAVVGADDPKLASFAILYPSDNSVITSEMVLVMAVASSKEAKPVLTLDGQPLEVKTMNFDPAWIARSKRLFPTTRPTHADPLIAALMKDKADKVLLLATAPLSAGNHTLDLGGAKTRIFRSTAEKAADAPAGMPIFHTHGPVKDRAKALACTECHEVSEDDPTGQLGLAKTPTGCQTCHSDVDVQLVHRHVTDSLAKCHTCHDPHGTTRAKLLIDTQEKLCTMCHEGGHSKR